VDNLQTISLPESLIEEAKLVTGKRTPRAAIKALVGLRYVPEMLRESERDFARGNNKTFTSAKEAMKWLKS
jgi:hypothetical protein